MANDHPLPIEGHLASLIDPHLLSDDDRRNIAHVVVDAIVLGTGVLARVNGQLERQPVAAVIAPGGGVAGWVRRGGDTGG